MAETINKQYLDFTGLQTYDAKIKEFAQGVAAQIKSDIIAGAPEAYDTLVEISNYISTHQSEYDALVALVGDKAAASDLEAAVTRITAAEASITTLNADETTVGSVKNTAKAYADAVDAKVTTLNSSVETNTSDIATLRTDVDALQAVSISSISAEEINSLFTTTEETV